MGFTGHTLLSRWLAWGGTLMRIQSHATVRETTASVIVATTCDAVSLFMYRSTLVEGRTETCALEAKSQGKVRHAAGCKYGNKRRACSTETNSK